MKKRHARSGSRVTSSPDVKSDGKARVDTGKPTLTQQGIDVDKFISDNKETAPEKQCENTRAIIVNALVGIYDSISALQRAAYHANDKVVYMFATKLMNGELMDIKANYSKDVAK